MTAFGSFYFPCSIQVSRIKFAGQKICFQSVDWNLAWEFCEILRSVCLRRIWSVSEILQISSRQALEVQCLEPRSSLLEFFFPHELVFFILDQQLFLLKATYHFHDHSQVSPKKKRKNWEQKQKPDSFKNRYFLLSAQNWDEASPTFSFYLILQNRRILRECWVDSLLNISISLNQSPFVTNLLLAFPILAA